MSSPDSDSRRALRIEQETRSLELWVPKKSRAYRDYNLVNEKFSPARYNVRAPCVRCRSFRGELLFCRTPCTHIASQR